MGSFTFVLSHWSELVVTAYLKTFGISAFANWGKSLDCFLVGSTTLRFPPLQDVVTRTVKIRHDGRDEDTEEFAIGVEGGKNADPATDQQSFFVRSIDKARISIAPPAKLDEGDDVDRIARFRLSFKFPIEKALAVYFLDPRSFDSASEFDDYAPYPRSLVLAPQSGVPLAFGFLGVTILGDTIPEPTEFFAIDINRDASNADYHVIGSGYATCWIRNDD